MDDLFNLLWKFLSRLPAWFFVWFGLVALALWLPYSTQTLTGLVVVSLAYALFYAVRSHQTQRQINRHIVTRGSSVLL